jgi:hypothetical protein
MTLPPDNAGLACKVTLFGAASSIVGRFTLGAVTHLPTGGVRVVERVVLLALGQRPGMPSGWQPPASSARRFDARRTPPRSCCSSPPQLWQSVSPGSSTAVAR